MFILGNLRTLLPFFSVLLILTKPTTAGDEFICNSQFHGKCVVDTSNLVSQFGCKIGKGHCVFSQRPENQSINIGQKCACVQSKGIRSRSVSVSEGRIIGNLETQNIESLKNENKQLRRRISELNAQLSAARNNKQSNTNKQNFGRNGNVIIAYRNFPANRSCLGRGVEIVNNTSENRNVRYSISVNNGPYHGRSVMVRAGGRSSIGCTTRNPTGTNRYKINGSSITN